MVDHGRQRHLYFVKIDKAEFYGILDILREEIEFNEISYSEEVLFYGDSVNLC